MYLDGRDRMKWWCDRRLLPVSVDWLGLRPTRFLYLSFWRWRRGRRMRRMRRMRRTWRTRLVQHVAPSGVGLSRLAICLQEATTIRHCVTTYKLPSGLDDGHLEYIPRSTSAMGPSLSISKALVRSGKARIMYRVHTL